MTVKILGAILIIAACGGFGYYLADAHRKEEKALRQLMHGIEVMVCELEYHLPPLPELCRLGAEQSGGPAGQVLKKLSEALLSQEYADAVACMEVILKNSPELPPRVGHNLLVLGQTLGRFDLQGQVSGMQSVIALCERDLSAMEANRDVRLRGYRTLGLCVGVALVIIFL